MTPNSTLGALGDVATSTVGTVDEDFGPIAGYRTALVVVEMSEEEYLALGETKHTEYYDGVCVVNPPKRRHQRAALKVRDLSLPATSPDHEIFVEWGWRTGGAIFRPDVMIVPVDGPDDIVIDPPFLVVEILSASNRLADLVTKREKYAAAGLPWYWIVDLDEPGVTVLQLVDGEFAEVQKLQSPGLTAGPVAVTVDPAALA